MRNKIILCICLLGIILVSCSKQEYPTDYPKSPSTSIDEVLWTSSPNLEVFSDDVQAYVDYSNANEGYIMAKRLSLDDNCKLQITKDGKKYNYDLTKTEYESFPLSMGDGLYTIKILRQVEGTKYAVCASKDIDVKLVNPNQCYLYPNQIVNYSPDSSVLSVSFKETKDDEDDLKRVYHLFKYTIDVLDYDYKKAEEVRDSYVLPDLEKAISKGQGICFDYASLLAALCRIQGIPAKVIVGWTDIEYHAWVEIYLEHEGWINPKTYFESKKWSLVDPTFADSNYEDYEGKYEEVYRY